MICSVYTIVLNFNNLIDTAECLDSLRNNNYQPHLIILVDNSSKMEIFTQICNSYPEIIHVRNAKNLGFAAGMNKGIEEALKREADWIFILNNDTILEPDCLEKLVRQGMSALDIGIVVPKIKLYSQRDVLWYAGSKKGIKYDVHRGNGEIDKGQYDQTEETDFATGCAMLIRSSLIEKIGLLDESYFFGMEDREFSSRCKRAGFKVIYCPSAVVYHKVGRTRGKINPVKAYSGYKTQFLYLQRIKKRTWPFWFAAYAIYIPFILPWRLIISGTKEIKKIISASLCALRDSVCQRS